MGRKEGLYKFFKLTLHFFGAVFLVLPLVLYAANYQTYPPNFEVTIGEFVYNDDFTATTDDCHVSVSDPSGSVVVNAVLMSADANGWHHYTFTPAPTEGTWPAFISCGTIGVDLIKQDKTFIVSSSVSTTTIAASVWDVATSTLTEAGTVGRHINDTLNAPVGGVVASVNANTNSAIENASSSLFATLPTSVWAFSGRTLTSFGSLVADVWAYGSRSLTSMGSLVADVWSAATRTLTGSGLDSGSLATLSDVQTATSSVASVVNANTNSATSGITSAVNANTNATVLNASTSLAVLLNAVKANTDNIDWTDITAIQNNVGTLITEVGTGNISAIKTKTDTIDWADVTGLVTESGQIKAKTDTIAWADVTGIKTKTDTIAWSDVTGIKTKTDTILWTDISSLASQITTASTSLATAINTASSSIVSQLASSIASIPASVWAYGSRTLSTFGTLASDVWSSVTRTLTGSGLDSGSLATLSDIQTATSSVASVVNANTNSATSGITSAVNANTNQASSSIAAVVNANTNAQIATASSSIVSQIASSITSIPANVWAYGSRSLTSMGSLVADVWSAATRTLTGSGLDSGSLATLSDIQTATSSVASVVNANTNIASTSIGSMISGTNALIGLIPGFPNLWTADLVSTQSVEAGKVYRAKVYTRNAGQQADSFAAPQITIYDVNRNVVVSNINMTNVGTGVYEYTYTVAAGAVQGSWESSISVQVESGQYINTNDFWQVAGSPAQVIINSISDLTIPSISANVTITNEGLSGYEYQYEWCVVSDINNTCGGGDDIFSATAAKYINPGEDFDTVLTATVPTAGNYYFKMIVYFGTDSSGASRSFTATSETTVTPPPAGGGGGGGGGGGAFPPSNPNLGNVISGTGACSGADFNRDKRVNSVDFSILLAFWKTDYPFSNSCVDINKDKKVNSVDFSILLSQWGTSGSVQN